MSTISIYLERINNIMDRDRKFNRKTVFVKCDFCGKEFEKVASEVKRNKEKGRHNYCCRECAVKGASRTRSIILKTIPRTEKQIKQVQSLKFLNRDKYSPFRYTYRVIKARYKDFNLTLNDLLEQWEKQSGICPYTGYCLILPENKNLKTIDFFHRASLDRIDSSLGYVKGNIQFVSTPINYMKITKSDKEIRLFLKDISKFTSTLIVDE